VPCDRLERHIEDNGGTHDPFASRLYLTSKRSRFVTLLNLTVPEMTVLVGGMSVLDANTGGAAYGVFTATRRADQRLLPAAARHVDEVVASQGRWHLRRSRSQDQQSQVDRTPVDLIFGSNSELRTVAEVYAESDGKERFVRDFDKAWAKFALLTSISTGDRSWPVA